MSVDRVTLERDLEAYLRLWKRRPDDRRVKLRVGEILHQLDRTREAVQICRQVFAEHASCSEIFKAMAVGRLILTMDPTQQDIKERLSALFAARGLSYDFDGVDREPSDKARFGKSSTNDLLQEMIHGAALQNPRIPPTPLFSQLEPGSFERVLDKITSMTFQVDEDICREGEEDDILYIIADGEVEVWSKRDGKPFPITRLKEGAFFGEFSFFSGGKRKASVTAMEETRLLAIKKKDFDEIAKEYPSVNDVLVRFYKERVVETLLMKSKVFGLLNDEFRKIISEKLQPVEVNAGDVIIREGEEGKALYLIKAGRVEIITGEDDSRLATLREGDLFGEISVITGCTRTATVRALVSCELLKIDREDFLPILENNEDVKKKMEEMAVERASEILAYSSENK